jgi:hypothetical protein
MAHSAQITIAGKTADGLSSRLRFLLEARRIRCITGSERYELRRLLDLARLGRRHEGSSDAH